VPDLPDISIFEASFGICIGCKLYALFFKDKVQYCPGEVCSIAERQDIQKTSVSQWLIFIGFIGFIFLFIYLKLIALSI
jgi:hypothetical protein